MRAPGASLLIPFALFVPLLAGCASPDDATPTTTTPARPVLQVGFLTPGEWVVRGDTDHLLAWVQNKSPFAAQVHLNLTGPAASPLPAGWNVTFGRQDFTLQAAGTKGAGPRGEPLYEDWAQVLVTLTVPPGTPEGDHYVELRAGPNAVHSARLVVAAQRGRVGAVGDTATLDVQGSYHSNGTTFWVATVNVQLGDPDVPPAIAFAPVGVTPGETVRVVAPPALAYGWDQPPVRRDGQPNDLYAFNGETLAFTVTLRSLSS